MKRIFIFLLGAACGSIVAIAVLHASQTETDPVKISPQYYTVKIDNDRVRVLEYRLKAGQKEPMHTHPPGIVYQITDTKFRTTLPDGSVSEREVKAGDVIWRDTTTHAAENLGTTDAHAIAVELKACK